jgi:two-component system phosphate regulon response regulator PhoB
MSRVLIVEDDPDVVALVKRWLERDGHQVEHAADGDAAMKALARDPMPQLVLLDVMLPKVDGFEVLRQIRAAPRTRALPVVMVTSFSRDRDASRGRELGATDYVVKPLMELEFMKRLGPLLKPQ